MATTYTDRAYLALGRLHRECPSIVDPRRPEANAVSAIVNEVSMAEAEIRRVS
jgi:hypothetical protein